MDKNKLFIIWICLLVQRCGKIRIVANEGEGSGWSISPNGSSMHPSRILKIIFSCFVHGHPIVPKNNISCRPFMGINKTSICSMSNKGLQSKVGHSLFSILSLLTLSNLILDFFILMPISLRTFSCQSGFCLKALLQFLEQNSLSPRVSWK